MQRDASVNWKNEMSVVGVITARGGSKGIPQKNLKTLGGITLIARSIFGALEARSLDRVIVSTDCQKIAAEAKRAGAEVPFLRPAYLATDVASSADTLVHAALNTLDGEIFVLLQPTSPFRLPSDIDNAIEKFTKYSYNSLVSICTVSEHPSRFVVKSKLDPSRLQNYKSADDAVFGLPRPRQQYEEVYRINGAIFVVSKDFLMTTRGLVNSETGYYEMPESRSLDLDTATDWDMAETILGCTQKEIFDR